ncbi:hypothetical protein D9M73_136990 [compost metagenome]
MPAAAQIERRIGTAAARLDAVAVAQIGDDPLAAAADRNVRAEIGRQRRSRPHVKTGEGRIGRVRSGAGHPNGRRDIDRRAVVEIFEVQANETVCECLGDVALDLAAALRRIIGVPDAIADAVEPANMKPPPFAKRRAIIGVDPGTVEIKPLGDADRSAGHVTGFADEIDDRARRVAGEGRGGTAAHHFDARDAIVGADEGVGGREGDIAEIQHRQAVFLKLDELAATACRRQTADRDVGVAFAA